jgi:hypothetical protein
MATHRRLLCFGIIGTEFRASICSTLCSLAFANYSIQESSPLLASIGSVIALRSSNFSKKSANCSHWWGSLSYLIRHFKSRICRMTRIQNCYWMKALRYRLILVYCLSLEWKSSSRNSLEATWTRKHFWLTVRAETSQLRIFFFG